MIKAGPFDKCDCAYAAGIIDGEGSIMVHPTVRQGKYLEYRVRVGVSNTDETLMRWLVETFGGAYSAVDRPKHGNWRRQYIWWLHGRHVRPLLLAILPHLKLKRRQAECALEFVSTYRESTNLHKHPPEVAEARERLAAEVCALNKRGRQAA